MQNRLSGLTRLNSLRHPAIAFAGTVFLLVLCAIPASADPNFFCSAKEANAECAFTIFDQNGGALVFTLPPQKSHQLGPELVGQKYCMQVVLASRPNRALDPNNAPACWKGAIVKPLATNQ